MFQWEIQIKPRPIGKKKKEKKSRQEKSRKRENKYTLRRLSQLPVQRAIPSEETPRQLTRFSCAVSTPTLSPLRVSQTLQLKSSYPAKRRRPEIEKATEVIPQRMLSCVYWLSSLSALKSKSLQEASSDPVPKASPLGKNWTALISDSCPTNVWTHLPFLISQTFAVASQAPETKMFLSGAMDKLFFFKYFKKKKKSRRKF